MIDAVAWIVGCLDQAIGRTFDATPDFHAPALRTGTHTAINTPLEHNFIGLAHFAGIVHRNLGIGHRNRAVEPILPDITGPTVDFDIVKTGASAARSVDPGDVGLVVTIHIFTDEQTDLTGGFGAVT